MATDEDARVRADDSPRDALEWTIGLPLESQGEAMRAVANIFEVWARKGRPTALATLNELKPEQHRSAAIERVAVVLGLDSPSDAVSWAASLPNAKEQDRALTVSVDAWARTDPAAAAKWALGVGADDAGGRELLTGVVSHWATQDADAASQWVHTVPYPSVRAQLIGTFFSPQSGEASGR